MPLVLPLNFDILREIARSSDRQTCATLIRSCRFFYQEAAKCVLHDPVTLRNDSDVRKLVRFLEPDHYARARYVRTLRLDVTQTLSPKDLHALEDTIAQMTQLEHLLIDEGEEFLESFPSLGNALANLTTLRQLHVWYAGSLTCNFLKATKSNLVSISLGWMGSDEDWFAEQDMDDEEWSTLHPVPLLAKWCSSLEELNCECWYTASKLPTFTDVYPSMRCLKVERDDFPLSAPYIRAYPNLARLSVSTDHVEDLKYPEDRQRLHEHRIRNIRDQEAEDGPGTWQHLEEYVGSLADLYLLGLTCHIPRVMFSAEMSDLDLELLSAVLACANPKHLNVEGDGALLAHSSHSLPVILREPDLSRLESLVLRIHIRQEHEELDVGAALDALGSALAQLPLRRLRLCIVSCLDPTPSGFCMSRRQRELIIQQAPFAHAESTLRDWDVDAFMHGLRDALPSLTDAKVDILGPRGSNRRRQIVTEHAHHFIMSGDPALYEFR
ncbi:hypothetical protein L227DRAFT_656263 [Lentinus tigrinus ALCF2SS1-6]|uniref:F-box domain-containing protein n=1 Tax=Lentinus tigrinus ALCF2SS1-6 TaxID=1328759 RepID=A0A5C2RZC8_9APHY|nr:hypothetical protein L227DRAFT_656263 [Lentinus tigrinus ALCF2SS1-6]